MTLDPIAVEDGSEGLGIDRPTCMEDDKELGRGGLILSLWTMEREAQTIRGADIGLASEGPRQDRHQWGLELQSV